MNSGASRCQRGRPRRFHTSLARSPSCCPALLLAYMLSIIVIACLVLSWLHSLHVRMHRHEEVIQECMSHLNQHQRNDVLAIEERDSVILVNQAWRQPVELLSSTFDPKPPFMVSFLLRVEGAESDPAASSLEFVTFSGESVSRQIIIMYKEPTSIYSDGFLIDYPTFVHNTTLSLVRDHRPYVRAGIEFGELLGAVVTINVDQEPNDRQITFHRVVRSIESHPSVLFVSSNHLMSLESVGQSVRAGVQVPPAVRRILAGSYSTVAKPADVAVAILDTGIDLHHPFINARNGINCVSRIDLLAKRFRPSSDVSNATSIDAEGDDLSFTELDGVSPDQGSIILGDEQLAFDDNNHGTHVGGIIGGVNEAGSVAGVAPGTLLYAVKILNAHGQGTFAHLLCGINWVMQNARKLNIKVASMSLAGSGSNDDACGELNSDALHRAICRVTSAGVNFVAAAGNARTNLAHIVPASYPEVLAVTAIADSDGLPGGLGPPLTCRGFEGDDHVASFSNYALLSMEGQSSYAEEGLSELHVRQAPDPWRWHSSPTLALSTAGMNHSLHMIDHLLAAPGACILSTVRNGDYAQFSGTSQACPYVSGVLALQYGSAGVPGPCHHLPPMPCMLQLVRRAKAMEQRAKLGYGYLPWSITSPNQRGTTQSDTITVPKEMLNSVADGSEIAPSGLEQAPTESLSILPRNLTAPRVLRKYYGPLVVGSLF